MGLWAIFLTGITTGGLSCLAVQGGLLAGYLASRRDAQEGQSLRGAFATTGVFLLAKLAAYTVLGFILGWAGSLFQLSIPVRVGLQIAVGLFMIFSALQLFSKNPFFRKFEFRPPAALRRLLRTTARGESRFTPALLGIFTVFIPCGTTQAMEVLAIGSGSPLTGALTLAVFTLGTMPFFFLIGVLAHTGAKAFQGALAKATAVLVLLLGIWTINAGLALAGMPYTLNTVISSLTGNKEQRVVSELLRGPMDVEVQKVDLTVRSDGYYPQHIELRKGIPVELKLTTNNTNGCARDFIIPSLKIERLLPETGFEVIKFTPKKTGPLAFSCIMGMYTGTFTVVEI